jgi:hypothetical protein
MKNRYVYAAFFFLLVMASTAWPVLAEETETAGESQATEPQYSKSTTLAEFEQEYQENGFVRLPDLRGLKPVAQKGPIDKLAKISGAETYLKAYVKDGMQFGLYQLKTKRGALKAYGFVVIDSSTKKQRTHWDSNGDGYFEQIGKDGVINKVKYDD